MWIGGHVRSALGPAGRQNPSRWCQPPVMNYRNWQGPEGRHIRQGCFCWRCAGPPGLGVCWVACVRCLTAPAGVVSARWACLLYAISEKLFCTHPNRSAYPNPKGTRRAQGRKSWEYKHYRRLPECGNADYCTENLRFLHRCKKPI